ncbi:MAG: alpha/beta fold hydrolase [Phycisphaerae bacterium]|jgi:pimeloyl-ACP methyl ester carboxylesterase
MTMLSHWSLLDLLVRNWAIVTFAATIAALVLVPSLVVLKYVRISLNIMRSTKPPLARSPLDFERMHGQPVTFSAYDGLPLSGMLFRASASVERRGMIVFAHEYCADMHSCARYCRPLQEIGYDIFAFDFRGHGQSDCQPGYTPRQWISNHDMADMRGAVAFVEEWLERNGLPRRFGVFGISRGAAAAILAASENDNIQAIVSDGGFSTDKTIEYFMRRWAYIFARIRIVPETEHQAFWPFLRWCLMSRARREFGCSFPSVRKALRSMRPRPMLFIHGEKDSYLPVEQTRLLYALAPQPKHLWIAPNARHNQAVALHPETYAGLTAWFFDRYLAGRQVVKSASAPAAAVVTAPLVVSPAASAAGA